VHFSDSLTHQNTYQFKEFVNADSAITAACTDVSLTGDDVAVRFDAALSSSEQTTLDTLSASFVPVEETEYAEWVARDQKVVGTNGGSSTAGTWVVRTLNTLSGSNRSELSLQNNQITLQSGTYNVDGKVPGFRVGSHQARFYNVTDSSTALSGTTEFSDTVDNMSSQTSSRITGFVTVASGPETFEVQHFCAETHVAEGFGRASGNAGVAEVYTVLRVSKKE